MGKFVSIPTVWTTYECADDVIAILGNNITTPPHIVLEMMVSTGLAKRVNTITTTKAEEKSIDVEDDDDDDDKKESPWLSPD